MSLPLICTRPGWRSTRILISAGGEEWLKQKERKLQPALTDEEYEKHWLYVRPERMHEGGGGGGCCTTGSRTHDRGSFEPHLDLSQRP
jgi:hypothetical protein